jgi:hypothetical protein
MSLRKHKIGTILKTKDGRMIGNAVIIHNHSDYNFIKTDCGNTIRLTDHDVEEMFYDCGFEPGLDLDHNKNNDVKFGVCVQTGSVPDPLKEIKMKLWIDAWAATAGSSNCVSVKTCTVYADKALADFNERFK